MIIKGANQLNSEDYVTYEEAAQILSASIHTLRRIAEVGILMPVKPVRSRMKFLYRDEVNALLNANAPLTSREAREVTDKVRRERSIAMGEKEYIEDGSHPENRMTESSIRHILNDLEVMKEQQEKVLKDQEEFLTAFKERAEQLLSLPLEDMFKKIATDWIEERMSVR